MAWVVVLACAAIAGAIALVVTLRSDDGRSQHAEVRGLAAGEVLTRRAWLRRSHSSATGLGAADLDARGVRVRFDVAVDGYAGERLPLRWELLDAASGGLRSVGSATVVREGADGESGRWEEWVRLPGGRHRYVVRVRLYDEDGATPLVERRSAAFTAAA